MVDKSLTYQVRKTVISDWYFEKVTDFDEEGAMPTVVFAVLIVGLLVLSSLAAIAYLFPHTPSS